MKRRGWASIVAVLPLSALGGCACAPAGDAARAIDPCGLSTTDRVSREVFIAYRTMEVGEMVDAALAGLDAGEPVTIPSLPDVADGEAYSAARLQLGPNLSRDRATARYRRSAQPA